MLRIADSPPLGVLSHHLHRLAASDLMTANPKTIEPNALAARALAEMERYSITSLFVLAPDSREPAGVIHLHDVLKAGVV